MTEKVGTAVPKDHNRESATKFQKLQQRVRRHGVARTMHHLAIRSINSVMLFRAMRCMVVERADPALLRCPPNYTCAFLSEEQLRQFARNPENELPAAFLAEALQKGDECLAICDGPTLAAYGWYSSKPTDTDMPGVRLHFSPQYVYMYKGYTHTNYRGQRLHPIGMTMALQHYLSRGFKGLVSYVDSNNFESLASTTRMGYVVFGSVYLAKIFGRYRTFASAGCEKYGFYFEAVNDR